MYLENIPNQGILVAMNFMCDVIYEKNNRIYYVRKAIILTISTNLTICIRIKLMSTQLSNN